MTVAQEAFFFFFFFFFLFFILFFFFFFSFFFVLSEPAWGLKFSLEASNPTLVVAPSVSLEFF